MVAERIRTAVRVDGIVQGVGFRPFVHALAAGLSLGGHVGNDADGVFAEVEGAPGAVGEFLLRLERDAPPLARIDRVRSWPVPPEGSTAFSIVASAVAGTAQGRQALVSADTATCPDCLRELADPGDRRFGYPFINCTNCGPRFTIVRDIPYDRARTTMAAFTMCPACAQEYRDPGNRRFHAEPTCCPACGPALALLGPGGRALAPGGPGQSGPLRSGRAQDGPARGVIAAAAELLRAGAILAVKGLGGYHLAVDATSEKAAAALRERKHREDKPFAVMVADAAAARQLCQLDEAAARLLSSARRPVVLLPRRHGGGPRDERRTGGTGPDGEERAGAGKGRDAPVIAEAVAPGNRQLGIMLPYTPLHHLLLRAVSGPMVLTSGNVSDEPIAYRDQDAVRRLGAIADAYLTHDRAIHIRTDDSVARTFRGKEMVLRRSRGYVPEPVMVSAAFPRPVLACGAELKNTFCLANGNRAFLSHHIGDLENAETLRSFTEGIEHYRRLFGIEPEVVAYDLHPEYLSTKYALDLDGVGLTGVQHHHAHIASCLADNGETGPVIGVAFDGTGYGTDGTVWGGEFLVADLAGFRRAGHLAPVPMPGGAAAVRQPWRMAAAYLDAVFAGDVPAGLNVVQRHEDRWDSVLALARKGINAPLTSSAGRLFDAMAALVGVRDTINYEGQAAIELEQLAGDSGAGGDGGYRAGLSGGEPFQVAGADLVRQAAADLTRGTGRPIVAARFQHGIVRLIEDGCAAVRDRYGLTTVALSGGVFQNVTVLGAAVARLEARGFRVLTHSRVPCNDGGISLGQAVVAAARDAGAGG